MSDQHWAQAPYDYVDEQMKEKRRRVELNEAAALERRAVEAAESAAQSAARSASAAELSAGRALIAIIVSVAALAIAAWPYIAPRSVGG